MERTRLTAPPDTSPPDTSEATSEPDAFAFAEAEEIWRLAARLQADAARRLEGRSKALAGAPTDEESVLPSQSFSLSEVKAIAEEAGLGPEFVELALRERAARRHAASDVSDSRADLASRFLGTPEERITVSRVVHAGKAEVLAAMERLFPAAPYGLELMDVVGDARALADAILVFKVPQFLVDTSGGGFNRFAYHMSIADLNRMTVSLHALDEDRTEVTIQLDLRYGKWRNLKVGGSITATFAAISAVIGGVIGMKLGSLLGAAAGVLLAGLFAGYLFYGIYRIAYRNGLRKGEQEMEELLRALDVSVRTGGAFSRPAEAPKQSLGSSLNDLFGS